MKKHLEVCISLILPSYFDCSYLKRRSNTHLNPCKKYQSNHDYKNSYVSLFACFSKDDRSKIKKLIPEEETLYLKYIIDLNKEIIRRGDNINLLFEDDN